MFSYTMQEEEEAKRPEVNHEEIKIEIQNNESP